MSSVVHLVRSVVAPLTRTRAFRWLGPRLLPPVELLVKGLSGGRVQVSSLLVHSLTLYTKGAKTGEIRANELMYTPDGFGNAIVAGTSFARERHPGWTYNLLANPDAEITAAGKRLAVHATLIPDGERDAAWALIEAQWPGYRSYERESGRVVRLFRLRPVAELGSVVAL
ncbi:MAG: nitroreductase family deazaflavin-dependent oxidoreductase [Cryobacterium sp.]|nr:nitroreductase family deazaflavin-dependent oxidoreductase [Cryobacterium sp.]